MDKRKAHDDKLVNHLGSTISLTDASGAVSEHLQYKPFGATSGSALSRFGYTGRELDSQTGLMYYRARWYDPQQGRFITQDPIGLAGGLNQYAYAANNPLTFFDPSGLSWTTFKQGLAEGGIDGFWQGLKYGLIFGAMSGLSAASGGTLLPAIMEVLTLVLGAAAVAAIAQQVYDLFSGNYCPDELHYRIGYLIGSIAGALVGGKVGSAAGYRAVTPRTPGSTVGMNGGGAEGEEFFENTMPEALESELALANNLGVKPVKIGEAGFDEAINSGTIKWAITEEGELVVMPKFVKGQEISHTALTGGKRVLAAGEAEVAGSNGNYVLLEIFNHSGHYLPSSRSLQTGRAAFGAKGIY